MKTVNISYHLRYGNCGIGYVFVFGLFVLGLSSCRDTSASAESLASSDLARRDFVEADLEVRLSLAAQGAFRREIIANGKPQFPKNWNPQSGLSISLPKSEKYKLDIHPFYIRSQSGAKIYTLSDSSESLAHLAVAI